MLDEQGDQPALVRQSLRTQSEQHSGANANIGEATVNPEGFWRRSRDSWHHGGGQRYGDRDSSDPERFYDSRGVDVFSTKHQATLCKAVSLAHTASSANTAVFNGGTSRVYVYNLDSNTLKFTSAPLTTPWTTTTVTGTPAALSSAYYAGFACDGTTAYIAGGASGIYSHDITSTTAASFVTGTVSRVWWVKGRLMAGEGKLMYNVTAAGALPAALATLPGTVIDMTSGPNHIYVLSYDNGAVVYKTAVKPDGTALDVPTVAGRLTPGDAGFRIFGWAGYVFVSTTQGIHMGSVDDNGNITFGSRIPSGNVVLIAGMAGDREFVWVGYPITGEGPGLLKLDLTAFTAPLTPAYAHDLAFSDGAFADDVASVISFGSFSAPSRRIFAAGAKVYVESASTYVTSGWVKSGLLALDLADRKAPVAVDVETELAANTSIVEAISVDRGATFTTVATFDDTDDPEAAVTGVDAARQFELRTTLTGNGTATPTLYRHTLKAEPHVNQGDYVVMRLRLFEAQVDNTGSAVGRTPATDLAFLQGLQQSREVIDAQAGSETFTATLRDLDWQAETRCASADDGSWNGVATLRLKVVA